MHGLELALDEISYDLAVSTGRMSTSSRTTCCLLPAAGFFSSKFLRKTDGRYTTSRFSTSSGTPSVAASRYRTDRNSNSETFKLENHRLRRLHGGGGFIMNPLAEIHSDSRPFSEIAHQ